MNTKTKRGGVLAPLDTNIRNIYDDADNYEENEGLQRSRKVRKSGGSRRKSFLRVEDDDEEDNDEEYLSPLVCSDAEESSKENNDSDREKSLTLDDAMRLSTKKSKTPTTSQKQRRRRRSSARFLRLSGRFDDGVESENIDGSSAGTRDRRSNAKGTPSSSSLGKEHLGELYRQAIRMNAENKINAGNSWGLQLIENMDKFIDEEDDKENGNGGVAEPSPRNNSPSTERDHNQNNGNRSASKEKKKRRRVNFTKASCALDASVKIYSCRVDDVHLTSYRVLANLNRTDRGKGTDETNDDAVGENPAEGVEEGRAAKVGRRNNAGKGRMTETLESNIANINMNNLDSVYDIDPLFHKMSKAFDEGGAKGLLLVNLKNSDSGVGIVLDSKEDSVAVVSSINEVDAETDNQGEIQSESVRGKETDCVAGWDVLPEGDIDIINPSMKIGSLLNGSSVSSVPLVPQLCGLREKFARLEADGYVKEEVPSNKSNRYANSVEEEKEAEEIIHREHLERTQASLAASMANTSFAFSTTSDADEFGMDDFGGGDDDGVDGFGEFAPMDDDLGRLSSVSFGATDDFGNGSMPPKSSTTLKLNALCSSAALGGGGDYDYFNPDFLEKITSGNQWAGSSHWTKRERLRRKRAAKVEKKESTSTPNRKKTQKERSCVSISSSRPSCLDGLFQKKKSSRKGKSDTLQLSQAAKKKQLTIDNLLPPDAGIGIEQLSCLFLRPNAAVKPVGRDMKDSRKNVGK